MRCFPQKFANHDDVVGPLPLKMSQTFPVVKQRAVKMPRPYNQDHHRSYPWLEMIHFRSGPLYLTDVMQRFQLSWWLDTDAYFPSDARGYDPFADFERRNKILQRRSRDYFERQHLQKYLGEVAKEVAAAAGGSGKKMSAKLEKAAEEFRHHVNEFVRDVELAWGFKIMYSSQKNIGLRQLWEVTQFWLLQHKYLMDHKVGRWSSVGRNLYGGGGLLHVLFFAVVFVPLLITPCGGGPVGSDRADEERVGASLYSHAVKRSGFPCVRRGKYGSFSQRSHHVA